MAKCSEFQLVLVPEVQGFARFPPSALKVSAPVLGFPKDFVKSNGASINFW